VSDRFENAEFLRKSAATLRGIARNQTALSPELIEIAEQQEREAEKIEAAALREVVL
jgi:hypothetical protein